MKYLIKNEQDMQNLVVGVLSKLKEFKGRTLKNTIVLALNGELGAGKTTFTKVLARELGITEPVTSPTFVIQKSYPLIFSHVGKYERIKKLVHIDAYRFEGSAEVQVLDLEETLKTKGNLIVIEWAENIKEVLPQNTVTLNFKYIDDTVREVTID